MYRVTVTVCLSGSSARHIYPHDCALLSASDTDSIETDLCFVDLISSYFVDHGGILQALEFDGYFHLHYST